MVARGKGVGEWAKWMKESRRYRLPVIDRVSHGRKKYSVKNTVSGPMALHGDRRWLHVMHVVTYRLVESRCCTPEISEILCVSDSAIKTNKTTTTKANCGSLPFMDLQGLNRKKWVRVQFASINAQYRYEGPGHAS